MTEAPLVPKRRVRVCIEFDSDFPLPFLRRTCQLADGRIAPSLGYPVFYGNIKRVSACEVEPAKKKRRKTP